MIECKVCNEKFNNMIPWRHLQKHNISTADYKSTYGDLVSPEFRELKKKQNSGKNNPNYGNKLSDASKDQIAQSNKGKQPWNKGQPLTDKQKELLSVKAKARNRDWKTTNTHPLEGRTHSEETKKKIKQKRATQVITTEQALKAVETKRKNGYDLAFFKGKTHTSASKEKISETAKKTAQIKRKHSIQESAQRLKKFGYELHDAQGNIFVIRCDTCKNLFNRTSQYASSSKITHDMCPTCYPPLKGTSSQEKSLCDFLRDHARVEVNNRSQISPKEIDIFLPDFNLGIEYNGLYWHSEIFKDKDYHIEKTRSAREKNIHLIHIFEDEWVNKPEIVKSRLLSLINKSQRRIYARKCRVSEIDSHAANRFVDQNHIQGKGRANVHLGLYYQDKLVSVMTFLQGDISKNIKDWELNRFCSLKNTQVVGGANRLFCYFLKKFNPEQIVSYSDRRWSRENSVYEKLGFEFVGNTSPNYWYIQENQTKRIHRYALKKQKGSTLSEREQRESQGYIRIYDCGSSRWLYKNEFFCQDKILKDVS